MKSEKFRCLWGSVSVGEDFVSENVHFSFHSPSTAEDREETTNFSLRPDEAEKLANQILNLVKHLNAHVR